MSRIEFDRGDILAIAFLIVAMIGMALLPGCAQNGAPTTQQANQIQVGVSDAVLGLILTADDGSAQAKRIIRIAGDVKAAAESGIGLADIQKLSDVISSRYLSQDDQKIARVVTALVVNHARLSLGVGQTGIIPPDKLTDLRALVAAMADEAIQTATPFANQ
jgi:hypothetical protein